MVTTSTTNIDVTTSAVLMMLTSSIVETEVRDEFKIYT